MNTMIRRYYLIIVTGVNPALVWKYSKKGIN